MATPGFYGAPGRLIPIEQKIELTKLINEKESRRYVVPVTMFLGVQYGSALAMVAASGYWDTNADKVVELYNQELQVAGQAIPILGKLQVSIVEKNTVKVAVVAEDKEVDAITYQFTEKQVADPELFKQTIDRTEYERYVNALTEEEVRLILGEATRGYANFLGMTTPKHIMAILKHASRLASVDIGEYLQTIRGSVDKWETNLKTAAEVWGKMINKVVAPAIEFAYRKTILVARNF
ncbi:MAG: hypothetical protein DSY94_08555 [SAR324 cluster bacterium]|uniref:Uncharacterized protein n=1 Tax=SAR324 cluster bacterium TaxID=2024889 RepID=A0A432GHQ8_9DELT|nr:MAG: hypothetical protein DSY94_08555 [SAR324 cluster bacterium]